MATLKAMLHPKTATDGTKTYRLAIRVTVNRKRSYLYLGHNIDPDDWDKKSEKVKRSHPKYKQLNRLIRKKYDQMEDLMFESASSKNPLTAQQITSSIKGNKNNKNFFILAEEHFDHLTKLGKVGRVKSDRSRMNRIKEFCKNSNLEFKEIDQAFLRRLKAHLISHRGVSERTVMNVFVLIRTIYNLAKSEGVIEEKYYPFGKGKVRIVFPPKIKIGLEDHELKKIEQLPLDSGTTIYHTRNIFLFSFYLAGIRISDVLKMKWSDVLDGRLYYQMGKNKKVDSLKLPDQIIAILADYEDDKRTTDDFIFPELKKANVKSNEDIYRKVNTAVSKFNKHLKKIAKLAGIDKKITCHIARHTFGNIAGDKISPQMLQKLYRHSHLTTTIGYQGNFIHKDADEALDSVLDF